MASQGVEHSLLLLRMSENNYWVLFIKQTPLLCRPVACRWFPLHQHLPALKAAGGVVVRKCSDCLHTFSRQEKNISIMKSTLSLTKDQRNG